MLDIETAPSSIGLPEVAAAEMYVAITYLRGCIVAIDKLL
jgi:hypothetical protein